MISSVYIENFKSFIKADFSLANLTLIAGQNGLGKSSFIQVFLLLRQSFEKGTLPEKGLFLNGEYVRLGQGRDVYAAESEDDKICFEIEWDLKHIFKCSFLYKPDSDFLQSAIKPDSANFNPFKESLFSSSFQYLCASRIDTKTFFDISDYHINQLNSLGIHGEYTPHYLFQKQNEIVPIKELCLPKRKDCTIGTQINAWMGKISPGIHVVTTNRGNMDTVQLGYKYETAKGFTDEFKPVNSGYGVTNVLPVITSILTARKGDLIIIENPEAHLHPSAQSVIGHLCALAAQNGVQLIIETHSDHILNGIRVAVRKKVIEPSNVAVYFFERDIDKAGHSTDIIRPVIDEFGRITSMPQGFMDEYGKNLDKLLQ